MATKRNRCDLQGNIQKALKHLRCSTSHTGNKKEGYEEVTFFMSVQQIPCLLPWGIGESQESENILHRVETGTWTRKGGLPVSINTTDVTIFLLSNQPISRNLTTNNPHVYTWHFFYDKVIHGRIIYNHESLEVI